MLATKGTELRAHVLPSSDTANKNHRLCDVSLNMVIGVQLYTLITGYLI